MKAKINFHLESHKDKYMFGGLVLGALLHATQWMALKTVLVAFLTASGVFHF